MDASSVSRCKGLPRGISAYVSLARVSHMVLVNSKEGRKLRIQLYLDGRRRR